MQPNIILIFCDDLGYGDLSGYGSDLNRTPRLDRMAEEGIRFTDFYVPAPLCTPSRAGLMTGSYPKRVGLDYGYRNGTLFPGDPLGLNPEEVTLPRILKDAGYATKMVGKWHLGDQPAFLPEQFGFDSYFGLPYSNDMLPDHNKQDEYHFPPLPLLRGDQVVDTDPNQASLTENYLTECVNFIEANKEGPFFLYFAHMYVHLPIYAPHKFLTASQNGPYGAAVEHIDHTTGVILDTLSKLGIDDDTLVIFTSDNGPHNEGGHRVGFFDSSGPLRGYKRSLHDGGIRVPMIAWWPGTIKPGTSDHPSAFWDWLPTACELAGIGTPKDVDGISFVPTLLGKGKQAKHDYLFWRWSRFRAVRMGKWKGVQTNKDLALYDLSKDLSEESDVAKEHPKIVARIKEIIDELE